ncbi:MAG TPA: MMPL family transporter [Thermomonospora sp.]|nr:MMPL family transporter [Thermomonospora sp.]
MIAFLTRVAVRAPRAVLAVTALAFLACGLLGSQAPGRLSSGGFLDPEAESSKAAAVMARDFGLGGMQLLLTVESPGGIGAARDRALRIVADLRRDPRIERAVSPWSDPAAASGLVSGDGRLGVIVASVRGDDDTAPERAHEIARRHVGESGGVTVAAGGQAIAFFEINDRSARDIALAEAVALPITFLLLVLFLRSVVAALIPVVVGVTAIVGTTAVLYLTTFATELSVFAMNLTTALGLALAIDYSLLIISRYREETDGGLSRRAAVAVAMRHGGRAVVFSGVTVAISLVGTLFFPMYFLRSMAFAGVAVVGLSILLTLTCVPALLVLLGPRIRRRSGTTASPVERAFLYRTTVAVQRRPVVAGLGALVVLGVLGSPILGLQVGLPDDRVLTGDSSARDVGDQIRARLDQDVTGTITVVVPERAGDLDGYAAALSGVPDVSAVVAPGGTYVDGGRKGPGDPRAGTPDTAYLSVSTPLDPYSRAGERQLERLRAIDPPAPVLFGGLAQQNQDTAEGIMDAVPLAVAWIAGVTFVLLLLLTGSIVLPIKALLLNTVSLSATFGSLVWIFQDGNLGGLGTEPTGFLIATVPVLLFCISFGLSMDYEVFLLSRFKEEWDASARTARDNDRAVALGTARTGRVITAAALLMMVVFAGIITSQVSLMRMFGVGLTLAVLADATLVRLVLVPAFMRLAGRLNWWAPAPLRPALARFGLREAPGTAMERRT